MINVADQKSLQGYARLAGFMYLFSMAVFVASFVIVTGFAVKGDFLATAHNVAASQQLFRIALGLRVAGGMTLVVLGWAFYELLKPVDPKLALFALLWRLVQAGLDTTGAVLLYAAFENYKHAPDGTGVRALIGPLLSSAHRASLNIQFVYLSVTTAVVFYLLLKSRFIPRILAGFGLLAGALFLVQSFAYLVIPEQVAALGLGMLDEAPIGITEVGAGLWLLLAGVDFRYWNSRPAPRSAIVPS